MKIDAVKNELLARKAELEKSLMQMSKERLSDGQVQDPGDQAALVTTELLHTSLQDAELIEYRQIVAALEKIAEGTYGICADCGKEISPKRLQSFPNAERCIACQEAFEEHSE